MLLVMVLVIGLLLGIMVEHIRYSTKKSGVLRVDTSEEAEYPYIFLELSESLEDITNKNEIVLAVQFKNYIPQK